MTTTTQLTWHELNDLTYDMLPDTLGPQWQYLIDDGGDEEPIYKCLALELVIETLEEITKDTDSPEDYRELIVRLKAVK